MCLQEQDSGGSRIFPSGGRQLPKWVCEPIFLAENCMKMKEFGPRGGGVRPWCPPLDPPLQEAQKRPSTPYAHPKTHTHTHLKNYI